MIGRTFLYHYILCFLLADYKITCLKIIDAMEHEFLPSQHQLANIYRKLKPAIKTRFIMNENRISLYHQGERKNLKQYTVEVICESVKESAYREVGPEGLSYEGEAYMKLYKQGLNFLVINQFYTNGDREQFLKTSSQEISLLTQMKNKNLTVIREFKNLIYPKCSFSLIDMGENDLLVVEMRNMMRISELSSLERAIIQRKRFKYAYYKDRLINSSEYNF